MPSAPFRPRIAFVLGDARIGGAERVVLALAGRCVSMGFPVDLVLLRAEGELMSQIHDGVRVVPLLPSGHRHGHGLRLAVSALPAMRAYLRRERPSAVLSTLTGTNLFSIVARGISGHRFRLTVREASSLANVRSAMRRWLVRWLYRDADQVVAVSVGVADDLARHGVPRGRLRVITNPIDEAQLHALSLTAATLPGFVADERPIVLSVGRLAEPKDFATLLRAFAMLRGERRARLLVLGEGPQRAALEHLALELGVGDDVLFPGYVANPYPWFRRAAVFVLSSRWEGYPNALLEAVALGTIAIASDCEHGPREILGHGRKGRLVPVGDAAALTDALRHALADWDAAQRNDRSEQPHIGATAGATTSDSAAATEAYLDAMLGGLWREESSA
jgi:glycosyltransferase involved in cell wall biosynthesis